MATPPTVTIGVHENPGDEVGTRKIEMPLCLGASGSVRHGQPDVVGLVGAAGEDLVAVDEPLVAVAHGPGSQRGEVGAGTGLGVADGAVDLAGQDARQEEAPSAPRSRGA